MEAALFVVFYGLILFGWSTFGSFEARLERATTARRVGAKLIPTSLARSSAPVCPKVSQPTHCCSGLKISK